MDFNTKIFKALSDPTRLRIVRILQKARCDLCVCEIIDSLNENQYNISRHARILREANILEERKKGRWVLYSIAELENDFQKKILEPVSQIDAPEDDERLKARLSLREGGECVIGMNGRKEMCCATDIKSLVKEKYENISSKACCSGDLDCSCGSSDAIKETGYPDEDITSVPTEALMGLGCGNPLAFAEIMKGSAVLDLGSGSGFDCFLASKKAKRVIGVDMTAGMIKKSREIAERNGYRNVEFLLGEIEHLPVEDNVIDIVTSNCVINLSPDKEKAFSEAYRVLKPGGVMVISDIVLKEDLPEELKRDPDAWCSCIAGAMKEEDYLGIIRSAGFEILSANVRPSDDIATSITIKAHKHDGAEKTEGKILEI